MNSHVNARRLKSLSRGEIVVSRLELHKCLAVDKSNRPQEFTNAWLDQHSISHPNPKPVVEPSSYWEGHTSMADFISAAIVAREFLLREHIEHDIDRNRIQKA